MKCVTLLLLCGAALAQERAFVEVTAPKQAFYVGERVPLALRFGFDREYFRTNAVPLFARRTDVPVQVLAKVPGEAAPAEGPTFAWNDGVASAARAPDAQRGGRAFTVLEIGFVHVPVGPGDLDVPAPALRYRHATQFDEDFVIGRVARDPRDETVSGAPLKLRILPLPAEGRPPEFDGAVGRFTVRAEADRKSVEEGGMLRLTLTIAGEGNAGVPRLVLQGFHVYGTIDEGGARGRTVRYDIAPLSADVKEVPAIPFAFLDPGPPAAYRVVRTAPIPLEILRRAAPGATPPPPATPGGSTVGVALVVAALAATAVAAALLARRRRAAREAEPDPEAMRVREALGALRARAAAGGPDLADGFAELLAAYLRCPPAAVIGPDLATRLAARGMAPTLAARVAATVERLVAARYGAGGGAEPELAALLAELERALGS